jgi:hypothetical protein
VRCTRCHTPCTKCSHAVLRENEYHFVVRDSSVAIETSYGLDSPGIEPRWRRDFPHPSRPALGPPSILYNGYRVSFPGVKRPRRGVNHPPLSSTEVKERV